jgi:hypothetical protein
MIRSAYLLIVVACSPVTLTVAQEEIDLQHDPGAKLMAIEAVSAMFLRPDPQRLAGLLDKEAQWKKAGPGSAIEVVEELRNEPSDVKLTSVREIAFFSTVDLPALKERFPKAKLWNADRVPQHLNNGLGCLVVWQNLDEKRPRDTELLTFVVKKSGDNYRIVYVDDLP